MLRTRELERGGHRRAATSDDRNLGRPRHSGSVACHCWGAGAVIAVIV
jgi:hypothetical protein